GQVADGESDQKPADHEQRKRPPERLVVEPEVAGQRREEVVLKLADGLEEEVRDNSDGGPDDRPHHEQREVAPALEQLDGAGSAGRSVRWSDISHALILPHGTAA